MRRTILKRGFLLCTVFLLLINICSPCVFAALVGSPYSQPYMPVCPQYYSSNVLPFGPDKTVSIYYKQNSSRYSYWWFFDKSDGVYLDYSQTNDNTTPNYVYNGSINVSGWFVDNQGINNLYNRLLIYSTSKIIQVRYDSETNTYTTSYVGTIDLNDTTGSVNYIRYKFISNSIVSNNSSLFTLIGSQSYYYNGYSIDYHLEKQPASWGSESDYFGGYKIAQYPDSLYRAVQTIENNQAELELLFDSVDNQLVNMQSSLTRIENGIDDLSEGVTGISEEISTGNQEVISEVNQNVNEQVSSAVEDINNAGEDISDIDDDISDVNSIVEKCSEWVSSLDNFADNIDEAESGVAQALENGKTLVNGFLGVAPPIVIALLTFALVFFVVRKVIGR